MIDSHSVARKGEFAMRADWFTVVRLFRPVCLVLAASCLAVPACRAQSSPGGTAELAQQEEAERPMQPKIVQRDALRVLGTLTPVKRQNEDPRTYVAIWNEFESLHDRIKTHSTDRAYYGIQFASDRGDTIDYLAGMAVDEAAEASDPLVVRTIPAARYAVFSCPADAIGPAYGYIFGKWLPASEHKLSDKAPVFEQYPPAEDLQSPVLIHVPIQ